MSGRLGLAAVAAGLVLSAPAAGALPAVLGAAEDLLAPATVAPPDPGVLDPIDDVLGAVTDAAAPVVDVLVPVVEPVVDGVVVPAVEAVTEAVAPVTQPLEPVLAPIVEAAAPVVGFVTGAVEPVIDPVVDALDPVIGSTVDAVGPALPPSAAAVVAPILDGGGTQSPGPAVPQPPIALPDAPVSLPDSPVSPPTAPVAPVALPDGPVALPDAPVASADQPTTPPPPGVGEPGTPRPASQSGILPALGPATGSLDQPQAVQAAPPEGFAIPEVAQVGDGPQQVAGTLLAGSVVPTDDTASVSQAQTSDGVAAALRGIGLTDSTLAGVLQRAVRAGAPFTFPLAVAAAVAVFLLLQDRIDRRDPKLATPVWDADELEFA